MKGRTAFELVLDRLCDAIDAQRMAERRVSEEREITKIAQNQRDKANEIALKHQQRLTEIDPDGTAAFLNVIARKLKDHIAITPEEIERLEKIAYTLDPIPF